MTLAYNTFYHKISMTIAAKKNVYTYIYIYTDYNIIEYYISAQAPLSFPLPAGVFSGENVCQFLA